MNQEKTLDKSKMFAPANILKFILLNALGIFMFFITITIGEKTSIPIDHIVSYIRALPNVGTIYASIVIVVGAILPFIDKSWNKDKVTLVFSIFKVAAIGVLALQLFQLGPESIHTPGMLPFVFNVVVIPVTTLVPVGAIFLAFLINYGLMEFIGVFMRPIMRPIWKTPGRSAIDAVASFVGSYSVGLLITNRVYKEGRYSTKEASIIATGFSTVSATFMVIVANTAGVMESWNAYFWGTLAITFLVTAITTRIYPLSKKSNLGYNDMEVIAEPAPPANQIFKCALDEGLSSCAKAPSVGSGVVKNLVDGIKLALAIGPTLMAIGFFGLCLEAFTPVFDIIGYIFLPFTMVLGFGEEAALMATASAISLAEMFLPSGILAEASPLAQATMAIVCVSEILFFSASIPCILSTEIKISLKDILIVWVERIILSLILATPFAMFFLV